MARLTRPLREAGFQDWDISFCLPARASLGLVCSTRQIANNFVDESRIAGALVGLLLHALRGSVVNEESPGFSDDRFSEVRMHFLRDWSALALSVEVPLLF